MRLDQVFWPWYEKDVVVNKTLPRERALELIESFLLHIDEMGRPLPLTFRKSMQGVNYIGVYTIGGVKPEDGNDACNELTLLILDALDDLRPSHPDFKFRWHPKVNPRIMRRAVEVIRSGLGQPSIKNDQVVIDGLMNHYGFTLEEARSYAIVGCISPAPSIRQGRVRRDAWTIRPAKLFELALNNGFDPVTTGGGSLGDIGPKTGDATKFTSFDQVFEALRQQIAWATRKAAHIKTLGEYANNTLLKRPLASCFFHRSLEAERDIMDTPEKGMPWAGVAGIVDCTDSLISLKKLVFDDKKYTMDEIITALRADWEGYEKMRQDFINAPKFGNDDDYADEIAVRTYAMLAEECSKVTDINGASPMPSGLVITNMYQLAPLTGALPNGRKLGDTLADGGCNPYAGYDRNGPMAAVLSASKIDSRKWKASIFNQKFTPSSIAGESGLRKFQSYIETALGLGLDMIQFNIVDGATLKAAQQNPEQYKHLTIRVSGYNARFVELNKFVQDAIIERTEHTFV
jgi:benzylsuccinate synthase